MGNIVSEESVVKSTGKPAKKPVKTAVKKTKLKGDSVKKANSAPKTSSKKVTTAKKAPIPKKPVNKKTPVKTAKAAPVKIAKSASAKVSKPPAKTILKSEPRVKNLGPGPEKKAIPVLPTIDPQLQQDIANQQTERRRPLIVFPK